MVEIETTKAAIESQGIWKGRWLNKPDGGKLIISTLSNYDSKTQIYSTLCRYELWEENEIKKTEVEMIKLRLYDMAEIEELLKHHGFNIVNKWLPLKIVIPDENADSVLYECTKRSQF